MSSFPEGWKLQSSRIGKALAREQAEGRLKTALGDLQETRLQQEQLSEICNSRIYTLAGNLPTMGAMKPRTSNCPEELLERCPKCLSGPGRWF